MTRTLPLVVGVVLLGPTAAAAQDTSNGNVAFSYVLLKDSDVDGTFPKGWLGAVSGRISKSVDIVAEVGQSSKSASEPVSGARATLRLLNYGAGPRFVSRASAHAVPFAQVLVGGARASAGIDSCGTLLTPSQCADVRGVDSATNGFALQPGGGADIALSRRVGVRLQSDYRYIRIEGENLHEVRFATGVVVRFGGS
jgi:Outer membrane protein beta-barrel domain